MAIQKDSASCRGEDDALDLTDLDAGTCGIPSGTTTPAGVVGSIAVADGVITITPTDEISTNATYTLAAQGVELNALCCQRIGCIGANFICRRNGNDSICNGDATDNACRGSGTGGNAAGACVKIGKIQRIVFASARCGVFLNRHCNGGFVRRRC